ncbi:MAG TPA: hypothetical protein VND94_04630 [Terriglobia bacterium]|nr:hypothetical protein [Terriglobia bacterium]
MSNSLLANAEATNIDTSEKSPLDHRATGWFTALWQAEAVRRIASHANLLSWIIALPPGLDPADAAASVLAYQQHQTNRILSPSLTALLQNVACYPAQRLAQMRSSRRRIAPAQ